MLWVDTALRQAIFPSCSHLFLHFQDDDPKSEEEREAERERERLRRWRSEQKKKELEALAKMMSQEPDRPERRVKPRHSRSRSRSRSSSRGRSSRRERSRSRDRDWEREKERERYKRDRDRDQEEEEEAYERRKLEKKIREKEMAYQERLKNWELRERKKAREYEKEKEREDERKAEESREARRLREFLEDYDDERDDPKFYKGSALERRLRDRQKEKEADARDRAKEKEELEEIKRKLFEEGHPDPETEIAKIERERAEHLRPMLQIKENIPPSPSEPEDEDEKPDSVKEESEDEEKYQIPPNMKPTLQPVEDSSRSNSASPVTADDGEESRLSIVMDEDSSQPVYGPSREDSNSKLGFGSLKFGNNSPSDFQPGKRKKLTVGDVFNTDDDDSADGAKKRKLVPLDYDDEKLDKKASTAEEKRAKIKTLIESIPTAKDELFAYSLDWSIVDQSLMDKRIKPWVNKKIIEYIGEEEPTLTNFICQKVMAQSPPQHILNDVAMVLDEEAEVFVVKMWRLLVYETEAKKAGLVK